MTWACIAASGTGSLILIADITHGVSRSMTSEVCRNIVSASLQRNASRLTDGRSVGMQQGNDPKQLVLDWPCQSASLSPTEHAFHPLETS